MVDEKKQLKRVYNIPLRKEFSKAPNYKRAKKAVNAIKQFLGKHMKSENVKLGQKLNKKVWERGIKKPPHHVMVNAVKDEEGVVKAELVGFEYDETKPEPVKKEKLEQKVETKEEVKVEAEKKEEVKVEQPKAEDKPVTEQQTQEPIKTEPQTPKPKKKGKAALQKELKELKKNA